MVILAIDTAGPDCAVALARADGAGVDVIGRQTERIGRGHADLLVPMIGRALGEAGLDYPDLGRLAVTVGPGSFTGIRAGIAAARGFALALEIPAVGVGVLEALAARAAAQAGAGVVVAALDARRGEIFALAVESATGSVLMPAAAGTPEAIAARIANLAGAGELLLTGSGSDLLHQALGPGGPSARVLDRAESADIGTVAALGAGAGRAGPPVPLYLRGADAKVQAGKAVGRR